MKQDHFYSIFRTNAKVTKGMEFKVLDLTSTELQLVDSVAKLFSLQKELKGGDLTELDKWKFVKKWESYGIEKKHLKYNEFTSHEMNLFLYFKDPAYFHTYICEFVRNKQEKTLVDYFLCDDLKKMTEYAHALKIDRLNAMEKTLMVLYFSQKGDDTTARYVFELLKNQDSLNEYTTTQYKK